MARPDYQGALGFELVTVAQPNGVEVHLIREAGADDREATLTERVLWGQMVALLEALQGVLAGAVHYQLRKDEQCVLDARAAIKATGGAA